MKTGVLSSALFGFMAVLLFAEGIPAVLLSGLSSENFNERESSQSKIVDWAREKKKAATSVIVKLSKLSEDPEVRQRCAVILRELSNEDYLSDGIGYLGINMAEEAFPADEAGQQRIGIRIRGVMRGSPADEAGLKAGDLILGLDGETWNKVGSVNIFTDTIGRKKPLVEVVLSVKRQAGETEDIKVKLGKRPVEDLLMARGDIELLDKHAKDQHFREWLKEQEK